MVKNHLKRIAVPKTWNIPRKEGVYITRPNPGAHPMDYSMSISLFMREFIKVAKSAKEVKKILNTKDVFVDKRKRTDDKYPVGIMDIIEFPQIEEYYRVLLDNKGRLSAVKADSKEAKFKLSKIVSKTKLPKAKVQLQMSDGRSIIVDKDTYKTGDSLQLELPEQKIVGHLPLEKGALVLLIGGKQAGKVETVEEISDTKILLKSKKDSFETAKRYAFVVGKDKPAFTSIQQIMG